MNDRLVWIDCEMTGLDLARDALIEVAALVTDFDLNVLGDGVDLVDQAARGGARPDGRLRAHHAHALGPARRSSTTASTLAEAEEQVLAYVREHCPDGSRPPLAGNTVGTDRAFLARDMADARGLPALPDRRRLLASRSWPAAGIPRAYFSAPAKRGNHRALADIQESIEELRYYREAVFVPPPGPDSDTAKALAPSTAARSPAARHRGDADPVPRQVH